MIFPQLIIFYYNSKSKKESNYRLITIIYAIFRVFLALEKSRKRAEKEHGSLGGYWLFMRYFRKYGNFGYAK
tara:strand:+ start:1533 stop:1748 length:216 start_codon:yes stop_codon:yes gene_type:complete